MGFLKQATTWNLNKRHVRIRDPATITEIDDPPLCAPTSAHVLSASIGCSTNQQRILQEGGLHTLKDISCDDGSFSWEEMCFIGLPRSARCAYNRLVHLGISPGQQLPRLTHFNVVQSFWPRISKTAAGSGNILYSKERSRSYGCHTNILQRLSTPIGLRMGFWNVLPWFNPHQILPYI